MRDKNGLTQRNAARIVASIFGVLAGLGGLTHGIGEVLQGNVAPSGIVINSWTQGPIATNMGGTSMYKWRANECDVTVSSGKVTDIQLVGSSDPGGENTQHEALYDRVIQAQSLQVDTISGATLTSKAYLQCVGNALIEAQHE